LEGLYSVVKNNDGNTDIKDRIHFELYKIMGKEMGSVCIKDISLGLDSNGDRESKRTIDIVFTLRGA
jgi:hypothetical protein